MSRRGRTDDVASCSLDDLLVIERLDVGAPVLSPRRLTARYTVSRKGHRQARELVYRYPEDVFDPADTADLNLASMIAAQVALNYGLFCKEIRFHGRFDEHDRRYLEKMAGNTAREIYVNKLLRPNPFLVGPAAKLPVERRESYLAARLVFSGDEPADTTRWGGSRDRVAVLSSGGKDSLVSFGMLQEIGSEVHPLFVNESGRHWFTALNAYRQFAADQPLTARVWTDSDRLFNWMLRQLPFVRPDFADVRADIYPIRLWTVAVFSFGVLPLLRKRAIARLVIGDEYDTTKRTSRHGITHYDGLYDQSRYFDEATSRYFRAKGWGVSQFSVLRPLSELLILELLARRYPELHRHQVSCHAGHVEDGRVRPCGRCEKCRRIVGMLVALGESPETCGYTAEQVERCLHAVAEHGIHQESGDASHLAWMLAQAGRLPGAAAGAHRPRRHPETRRLRIDSERSPIDAIPVDLRRPIYEILLLHADGAVRREGRTWVPFDLLRDPAMSAPYRFEAARVANPERPDAGDGGARDYMLGELTWPAARARLKETDIALLPVGAVEQHGPHLPLDIDAWDADYLARRVAAGCRPPRPLVLPPIPYGVSYHHDDFAGTLTVGPDTLSRFVHEVGMSAARQGITKLIIINGHGGNVAALQFAAQLINRDAHIFTCVDTGDTSDTDVAKITETRNDVHAGEIETSTALATRPELVRMDQAKKCVPRFSSTYLDFSSSNAVEWYARTSRISRNGVLGDPTKASREKGEQIWRIMIDHLVAFVESLKGLTLDEIYERRY